ncbi:hypothetical protein MYBA111488_22505 [Mycobacterium basiliense]
MMRSGAFVAVAHVIGLRRSDVDSKLVLRTHERSADLVSAAQCNKSHIVLINGRRRDFKSVSVQPRPAGFTRPSA